MSNITPFYARNLHSLLRRLVAVPVSVAVLAGASAGLNAPQIAQAAPANLFASVNLRSNPQGIFAGGGTTRFTRFGPGRYEVTFDTDVSRCAYIADTWAGLPPASQTAPEPQAMLIYAASGHLSANGVYLEMKNQGGGLGDAPGFNLYVDCGNPGTSFAVVDAGGSLVRSTPGTGLTNLGYGRYDVTFPSDVSSCSFLATVADPGAGIVLSPNLVFTGSGPNSDTVYIETKNLAGGLNAGIPFHLAAVCPAASNVHTVVVDSTGMSVRGSPLTSALQFLLIVPDVPLPDGYLIVTDQPINTCATVATRGSTNALRPVAPATIEIDAENLGSVMPSANTAGISIQNLLFGGGGEIAQAFHAAVIC